MKRRLACALGLLLSACVTPPSPPLGRASEAPAEVARLVEAGDPSLVVFATVWCEACKREAPQLREWLEAAEGRRVIYVVSGSPADRVEAYAQGLELTHERLDLVVDADGAVARAYGVSATPTLVLRARGAPAAPPVHAVAELPEAIE